jgi:hypothetical protein
MADAAVRVVRTIYLSFAPLIFPEHQGQCRAIPALRPSLARRDSTAEVDSTE